MRGKRRHLAGSDDQWTATGRRRWETYPATAAPGCDMLPIDDAGFSDIVIIPMVL
jgi:hypothetical protein